MKKYMFCFLLFVAASAICLGIGFAITKDSVRPEEAAGGNHRNRNCDGSADCNKPGRG
uniref:hypothetical protein n=1 Tax=Clostridium sp. NkU-1 TaxID=1095009 RepID=UPI000B20C404